MGKCTQKKKLQQIRKEKSHRKDKNKKQFIIQGLKNI